MTNYPARYLTKIFLDSNIILEGRPLAELPWSDLALQGPILILLTPRLLREVDSKKRDGRLGQRAREFNRLVSKAVVQDDPMRIVDGPIEVALGIAHCERIPWDTYDDLNQQEADSNIVAEILHVKGVPNAQRLFISHDIYPIAMARRHGLRYFHSTDNWLRPRESSPLERENSRLKQELSELRKSEPDIEIGFDFSDEVYEVLRVSPLLESDARDMTKAVLQRNQKFKQKINSFGIYNFDNTLDERYAKYQSQIVPSFVSRIHRRLEDHFNLIPIAIRIQNKGKVLAKDFQVEIELSNGWMNDKPILFATFPSAPQPRELIAVPGIPPMPSLSPKVRRATSFMDSLQDLRHGREWTWSGFMCMSAEDANPDALTVRVTASNILGTVLKFRQFKKSVVAVQASDLIDFGTLQYRKESRLKEHIQKAISGRNFEEIDIDDGVNPEV